MNITTHLKNEYWLSVDGLKRNLDYSESAIRSALKDAVRGGG